MTYLLDTNTCIGWTGRGLLIGGNDLLIAAIALAKGCTLVTHNTAEFSRVAVLVIEDWQVP